MCVNFLTKEDIIKVFGEPTIIEIRKTNVKYAYFKYEILAVNRSSGEIFWNPKLPCQLVAEFDNDKCVSFGFDTLGCLEGEQSR